MAKKKKSGSDVYVTAALVLVFLLGGVLLLWHYGILPDISLEEVHETLQHLPETIGETISQLIGGDQTGQTDSGAPPGDGASPGTGTPEGGAPSETEAPPEEIITLENLPPYAGAMWVELNGGMPDFTEEQRTSGVPFERYSELDELGRCGPALALIGKELMPTDAREPIGMVRPSGWHLVKYDWVDGKYLYNRCHLIGFQLTGENANEKNLITGTRQMNLAMLPFENQAASYIRRTGRHVLYRSTPVFREKELLARGVELEAWSLEDNGAGVCFHIFLYNVQDGVDIDYATGDNAPSADAAAWEGAAA